MLFITLLATGVSSCRKDNHESIYFSFRFDNVTHSFDSFQVKIDSTYGLRTVSFSAWNKVTTDNFHFDLDSRSTITGEYNSFYTSAANGGSNVEDVAFLMFYKGGRFGGQDHKYYLMQSAPFTIRIDQVSNSTLRINGSFTGAVFDYDSLGASTLHELKITDGKFNVPFIYR